MRVVRELIAQDQWRLTVWDGPTIIAQHFFRSRPSDEITSATQSYAFMEVIEAEIALALMSSSSQHTTCARCRKPITKSQRYGWVHDASTHNCESVYPAKDNPLKAAKTLLPRPFSFLPAKRREA